MIVVFFFGWIALAIVTVSNSYMIGRTGGKRRRLFYNFLISIVATILVFVFDAMTYS
jgi:hypothetical protein